jgi:peptidyl-tRNA hydrolase, PTH1 family
MIKLFVGLGNPGAEYEATRHNAGFWFIDALARELKCSLSYDKSYYGLVARKSLTGMPGVAGQALWLLEPQTFMNLSGKSVGALAKYFKIAPEEILVAHDELDIVPGQAKLKLGGSHAGHNGLRDIHAQLGTDQYWRLRIGIGHPGVKSEVIHWVLKKPLAEHRDGIEQTIERQSAAAFFKRRDGKSHAGGAHRQAAAAQATAPRAWAWRLGLRRMRKHPMQGTFGITAAQFKRCHTSSWSRDMVAEILLTTRVLPAGILGPGGSVGQSAPHRRHTSYQN